MISLWMLQLMVVWVLDVSHALVAIPKPYNNMRSLLPLSHRSSGSSLTQLTRYASRLYLADDSNAAASSNGNDGKKKSGSGRSWKPQNQANHKPGNDDKEFIRPGISYYMEKLVSAAGEGDWWKFVKSLKSLAMEPNNAQCIPQLVPLLDRIDVKKLDGSLTADLVWSLGRLNFAVTHSEQKPLLMSLMYRFCELEEMSSREVTTSLVGFGKVYLIHARLHFLSYYNLSCSYSHILSHTLSNISYPSSHTSHPSSHTPHIVISYDFDGVI